MERAERQGLSLAFAFHVLLFGALSLNWLRPAPLPKLDTQPIEVTLSDEVAPISTAPEIAPAPAAETLEPPAPAPAPLPLPRSQPQPLPRPAKPVALPRPATKAAVKPAPAKAAPARPAAQPQRRPGLSRDLVAGLTDTPSRPGSGRPSAGAPAKAVSAAVKSSIGAEVRRQLKPHWKSPTGADVEQLRTKLLVKLNRDGSLAGPPTFVSQSGVNDSNRAQARLHIDQAIKAVRLAAPFKLPADYYDAWREIEPVLYKGL